MTVMLIQLEGDDATLQEGIRTFKEAMGRTMPQVAPRPALLTSSTLVGAIPSAAESNGDTEEDALHDRSAVDADETETIPSTVKASAPRPFPKMQIVKDLDLRATGKTHLKALLDEKRPKTQNEKITLCLYYLRRVLEIDNVTANHIYTCMDDAKIRVPNDLPQTIRNIAAQKGWVDCANSSALEITTKGVNLVQHDLPNNGQ